MELFWRPKFIGMKLLESAKRKLRSSEFSGKPMTHHFAVCTNNEGFEASLEPRKLYQVVEDEAAASHGMMRIIDESGEDYLYPAQLFTRLELPETLEKQLSDVA
ncbi:hypothetical protein [Marinobacter guineae]|nr:hypothetical protein [Marinobacter guineae]